jgi:ABC-2 type transport system ATP-binding protein
VNSSVSSPVSTALLRAAGLTKRFGDVLALDELHLGVNAGDIFCLLGANGAGKTTTINCFLGFLTPDGGTVSVCGVDVVRDPLSARRQLAYIPEQVALYRHLSGLENLEFFAGLAGCRERSPAALREFLSRAGLASEAADRRVGTYSKGMRQKVGVALALAKNAQALLLDEPTSGLDPKAANEFSRLVRQLADEGAAVLMTTHDLFHAKETGTHVGIMKGGRLLEILPTAELAHRDLEKLYLAHMAA